jgi:hypothetical protein
MRDFKGMKRQRGRNRGGSSGGGGGGGGGGKPQHNVNRAFESNGPDNVKIRGNAQHVFEKYQQLARDATAAGDRVLGENYLQHAEHYFRVIRAVQPNKTTSEIMGRDSFASGYDIDFEDESGAQAATEDSSGSEGGEAQGEGGDNGNGEQRAERSDRDRQDRDQAREWRSRDERPRDDRQRDDRPQGGQGGQGERSYNRDDRDYRPRDDRSQGDRPRDDRPRDDRSQGERSYSRDDRPRDDRPQQQADRPQQQGERPQQQGDRPREGRRDRFRDRDRPRDERPRDPMAVIEPESTPMTAEVDAGPRLRSQDGSESHAPAFLQARPPAAAAVPAPEAVAEDGEAKKPRRRRAPRSFEGGEGEAPAKSETEEA